MANKILLVDDEQFFLEGLKEGLSEFQEFFTTDICFSVDQAIKLIKKNDYDLIISDIRMPKKSGLDLFEYLRKNKYQGGFIAMTAYGTEEILHKIKKLGVLDIILKPFDFSWFREKIMDFFREEEGVSGVVDSVDLTSLLQMINLEKKSLSVKIDLKNRSGCFHFKKGEIIHAGLGDIEGEEAVYALLKTKKGRFSVAKEKKEIKRTIDVPFMVLLMKAIKQADEENKILNLDKKDIKENDREEIMNVKKLNEAIEVLKENMGEGLLATDIFDTADGQSIIGWNSNPQACALFNRITNYMNEALDGAGFPALGRYYIMDLAGGKMVVVIALGEYQWGMLVDRAKVQLGLLLNIVMPKIIDGFEQAMTE
ncbi:MAG: response regulator [Candidatus Aminicenantes bacterium]|nr:response regulator [Candidatus Aminicenantes bacterium]